MPTIFNLCSFYEQASDVHELDVTMAEAFYLHDGSEALVREALRQCGVEVATCAYAITRSRCFYYTSFPSKGEEWNDRWQICWTIRITGERIGPAHENRLVRSPNALAMTDRGSAEYQVALHDSTALLIFDFPADLPASETQAQAIVQDLSLRLPSASPRLEMRSYGPRLSQARILLAAVTMPAAVEQLDSVLEEARREGVGAHVYDRDRWPQEVTLTDEMRAWQEQIRSLGRDSSKKD